MRPIHSGLSINITRALFLVIHRWIRHHRQRDSLRQGADEWLDTALAGHSATENETDGHWRLIGQINGQLYAFKMADRVVCSDKTLIYPLRTRKTTVIIICQESFPMSFYSRGNGETVTNKVGNCQEIKCQLRSGIRFSVRVIVCFIIPFLR